MSDTFTKDHAEVDAIIQDLIENDPDHRDLNLAGVTVATVMRHGDGPMQHASRTVAAFIKRTSYKDRVIGHPDAIVTVDEDTWNDLDDEHRRSLIDHELYHLIPHRDDDCEADSPTFQRDAAGRPKIVMRKHDIEVGWFLRMAEKHGAGSMEVTQAKALVDTHGQLLFGFGGGEVGVSGKMKKSVEALARAAGPGGSVTISTGGTKATIKGK